MVIYYADTKICNSNSKLETDSLINTMHADGIPFIFHHMHKIQICVLNIINTSFLFYDQCNELLFLCK